MFYLRDGEVVPGKGIGPIRLGMTSEQVRDLVDEFTIEDLDDHYIFVAGDVQIWMNKAQNKVTQIMVFGDFKGRYAGVIGVGSTLEDVESILKKDWYEELDAYFIKDVPGICFQLTDDADDAWDENEDYEIFERKAPIGYLSIFRD